jgi:hypothetical protein
MKTFVDQKLFLKDYDQMIMDSKKFFKLKLGSYNITADFFSDPKDEKDNKNKYHHHHWINRKKHVFDAIRYADRDVFGLQELSPTQALDFLKEFPEHNFYFFVQAQTEEVNAGSIYSSTDEIKDHILGKNIGTALIAIMYNPKKVTPERVNMFWYNPKPFEKPTLIDRSLTDKGFGNMNTPRGPGYVRFIRNTDKKPFWFFVSHAPISGGSATRTKCFQFEHKVIKTLVGTEAFFSIGDRNIFGNDNFAESYKALVPNNVYDWMNIDNHDGYVQTWLGFLYEPLHLQNQIQGDGRLHLKDRLDIGYSSHKSIWSACYPCVIRKDKLLVSEKLSTDDNLDRNFASDHMMVLADFNL